jgi:hypothetical protein
MNSNKTKDGFNIDRNVHFLGRSGVKVIQGLRIGYLSGIDSDLLGETVSADTTNKYLGNYFNMNDINKVLNDYNQIVKES